MAQGDPPSAEQLLMLFARARAGDKQAADQSIEGVHALYGGGLLAYIRHRLGSNAADAETILWRTYLKLWQAILRRPQEWPKLKSFLYLIADGVIADYFQDQAKRNANVSSESA